MIEFKVTDNNFDMVMFVFVLFLISIFTYHSNEWSLSYLVFPCILFASLSVIKNIK